MKLHSGDFQINLPIKACMETTHVRNERMLRMQEQHSGALARL